jgi:hypothetical protein
VIGRTGSVGFVDGFNSGCSYEDEEKEDDG